MSVVETKKRDGFYYFTADDGEENPQPFPTKKLAVEGFYIDAAYGHLGSAIRDNSRTQKISMGKEYENGSCHCSNCIEENES